MPTVGLRAASLRAAFPAVAHVSAAHAWRPVSDAEKLAHAATPLPDRIVLKWAGDSATAQGVAERTAPSVECALAPLAATAT